MAPVAAQMGQRSDIGRKRPRGRATPTCVPGAGFRGATARNLAHLEVDTRTRPGRTRPFVVVAHRFGGVQVRDVWLTNEVEAIRGVPVRPGVGIVPAFAG